MCPNEIKKHAPRRAAGAQERISFEKNQARTADRKDVLSNASARATRERLTARTRTYRLIHFPGQAELIGKDRARKSHLCDGAVLTGDCNRNRSGFR